MTQHDLLVDLAVLTARFETEAMAIIDRLECERYPKPAHTLGEYVGDVVMDLLTFEGAHVYGDELKYALSPAGKVRAMLEASVEESR